MDNELEKTAVLPKCEKGRAYSDKFKFLSNSN